MSTYYTCVEIWEARSRGSEEQGFRGAGVKRSRGLEEQGRPGKHARGEEE